MKRRAVVLALLLSAVVRAGADEGRDRGESYFRGFRCGRCHRVGDEGGTFAPDLTFVGFRKTPEWLDLWLKDPTAWKHGTAMPQFGFPDGIRADLVAYLSSLKGQAVLRDDDPPWNKRSLLGHPVKRGKVIFDRAGCRACHGLKGRGGFPNNNVAGEKIPALTYVADGYTREELRKKIRLGSTPVKADPEGPDPLIRMPSWGKVLHEDEIADVAEYILSLRPKKKDADDW